MGRMAAALSVLAVPGMQTGLPAITAAYPSRTTSSGCCQSRLGSWSCGVAGAYDVAKLAVGETRTQGGHVDAKANPRCSLHPSGRNLPCLADRDFRP